MLRDNGEGAGAVDAHRPNAYRAQAGDLVHAREALWRVMQVRASTSRSKSAGPIALRAVSLRGADDRNRWQHCTLLEPFDRFTPCSTRAAPRTVSRRRWMRAFGALVASAGAASASIRSASDGPLRAGLVNDASDVPMEVAALADARVALLAHQLEPLLAILRGVASRVLLADGVGLGKTVQAALVLRALQARGQAARVLILVPAGLRDQWRQELQVRVGLESRVIDAPALAAHVRELPSDLNPWAQPGIVIVSLDFIKQDVVLHGLAAIVWDALIVDEAHALTAGTDRAAAAHLLARHSRIVLLLTATPHAGSDAGFDALCRIGGHDDDDPIAIFRRTRRSLGLPAARRVRVLRIRPTSYERHLHDLLARYVTRVEREHRPGEAATLAVAVLQKRASSSAWSLMRSLERRLALLLPESASEQEGQEGELPAGPAGQPMLPFDAEGNGELDDADGEPFAVLSAPGLVDARVERAWLSLLIQAARRAAHHESKLRVVQRLLRRVREPAIVYTEYRDTLTHLAAALPGAAAQSLALLHGGLTRDARQESLRRVAAGDARLLLATDAAGEGLNLQQRCRLVINVELPWNPNRLEQRIGRVDRLGQSKTVHAVHLVLAGTSEESLLDTLSTRVTTIASALGERPDVLDARPESSSRTAESAPESAPTASRRWPNLSVEARRTVSALERVRALHAAAAGPADATPRNLRSRNFELALETGSPWVATVRRRRGVFAELAPGLLCIWRTRVRLADSSSHRLHELITPLHVSSRNDPIEGEIRPDRLATRHHASADDARAWPNQHDVTERMLRALDALARSAIQAWNERERPFHERAARRVAAIWRSLRTLRADRYEQPLLFGDITADREARQPARWQMPPDAKAAHGAAGGLDDAATACAPAERAREPAEASARASFGAAFDHSLALVLIMSAGRLDHPERRARHE